MKVLFDHIVFQNQKVGGVSRALTEMLIHLPQNINVDIAIKESDNLYLHEELVQKRISREISYPWRSRNSFLKGMRFHGKDRLYDFLTKSHLISSAEITNSRFCEKLLKDGDYDVFQPTHYNSYFLNKNKKPFVFIIHDIIPELFPQIYGTGFPDIKEREKIIKEANHIVAISENTKKDILERWNLDEKKITAIPWGAPDVSNICFKKIVDYPYLLYVGGRRGYKRFMYFTQNAKDFLTRHKDIHVICTGVPFSEEEQQFLLDLDLLDRFHTMFVTTSDLYSLYRYAICFVFPSLYEGFGLPTLEAMSCGCPVLISNKSCFPEIGGEVAMYIEDSEKGSSNVASQLDYIYRMSGTERDFLVRKGIDRAKLFSWEKTAGKYAEVYKSLF